MSCFSLLHSKALQKKEMEMVFSWNAPAKKYMALFENMLSW